jgi:sarcosine oxidase subunit alpha
VVARRLPIAADAAATQSPRRARFTFDGRPYEGIEGEPLAVSLLAADRLILSRSFRFHRPRGLMCDTGQCGWCECEVDGRPSVRSCQVPVRDGLAARSEHAWPSVERDLFGWLDVGSRFIPPTFYHHRFLRPKRLRKLYLDVIRSFGGRGRLPVGQEAPATQRVSRELAVDVLVVGGGRSGVAAAEDAARR